MEQGNQPYDTALTGGVLSAMSSTGRDISEQLSKLTSGSYSVQQIAQLMTIINRRTIPLEEDEALVNHVIFGDLVDIMNETTSLSLDADLEKTVDMDGYSGWGYRKFIPDNVRAYDLTHNNSNAGGITFPPSGITQFESSTIGRKNMGAAQSDGASYQIIEDHSWLNPTDKISIACWLYLKSASSTGPIIKKSGQYELRTANSDKLQWVITPTTGPARTLEYTYTPDAWYHAVVSYNSTDGKGQKMTVDNVLQASDTVTSGNLLQSNGDALLQSNGDNILLSGEETIATTTNNLTIFGDGTNYFQNGSAIAWLSLLHEDVHDVSGWVGNHYTERLLNTDDAEEITTIPYLGSLQEMPDSFEGLFIGT